MHKRTTTYARTLLVVLLYGGDRQSQMGGADFKALPGLSLFSDGSRQLERRASFDRVCSIDVPGREDSRPMENLLLYEVPTVESPRY